MYTLRFELNDDKGTKSFHFNQLNDIFNIRKSYEAIEEFNLADVFDNLDYGMNVLKYIPEKKAYVFIYSNALFWDYFKENLHNSLKGCLIKDVFPKIKELNFMQTNIKSDFNKQDSVIKLYENDQLIKAWLLTILNKKDLIYLSFQDQTNYYIEKIKEETIFNYSDFPIVNMNSNGELINFNQVLPKLLNYTSEELRKKDLKDLVFTFNSPNTKVKTIEDGFKQIFNKKLD